MSYTHNPCDICLDERCNGTKSCNCKTCSHVKECYKFLHPTIRITTKCTQACSHCCFECSPEKTRMMTVSTAQDITQFLQNNHICSLNVMGGEFYCNPDWDKILRTWLRVNCHIRLVSNGDWTPDDIIKDQLLHIAKDYPDHFHISISYDKYHTNTHVEEAELFLQTQQISHDIGRETQDDDQTLIPVGRAELSYNLYSFGCCYCHNPKHQYSFLIDETGDIYKCSFGVLRYANIQEFQTSGFASKFKEFNQKFYECFLPSCKHCIRICSSKNKIVPNN